MMEFEATESYITNKPDWILTLYLTKSLAIKMG